MERTTRFPGRFLAAVLTQAAALVLGACQSTPAPEQMSRTTTETAPADLQLLCAEAAGRSAGTDASKVLPVGSRRIDARSYKVDLNVGGATMGCTIDDQGNVGALGPA